MVSLPRVLVLTTGLSLAAPTAVARAPLTREAPKTDTSGLALSTGLQFPYGFLGGQAAYYLQLRETTLRAAPYAGVGYGALLMGGGGRPFFVSDLGGALGVMGSWGRTHRLVVDAFYGTIGYRALSLHGEPFTPFTLWGPGFALGYEYMAPNGLFFRTSLGLGYAVTTPIASTMDRFELLTTLVGIGYKLW
jgi:hypothetical protein